MLVAAAPSPAIDDPEARVSNTLVSAITVRSGGPVWWTVSKGARKVQVLGVLWSYPPAKPWNQTGLQRRLRSAKAVLLPAMLEAAAIAVIDDNLPPGDWDKVAPGTRAKVTAAAASLGKPAARYLGRPPLVAGYLLVSDFRDRSGLKPEAAMLTVAKAIRAAGVEPRTAGVLNADRYTKALSATTVESGQACLDAALAEVAGGETPMRNAVEAWTYGDVTQALTAPRGLELCGFALPGQADLRRAAINAQVSAIAVVLDGEPGARPTAQYVAIVNLRSLLAEDGVLDKLRQRGYQVTSPQD